MNNRLDIRLLGGLEFSQNNQPLEGFRSGKVAALLAWLAVNRRVHQRESLAGLFWGELSDSDAANNLRQSLSNLRSLANSHLTITRQTVAFRTDVPYALDVETFAQATGQTAGQTTAQRIQSLHAAVDLYRGDFLEGVMLRDAPAFEEWMLAQRARYREIALQAMHELVELRMDQGDYTDAIHTATRLLALDSWREEAHRTLMLALARTGQSSAALAQYENCRQILQEVFGAEPSVETTQLYERIRAARRGPRHNLPLPATELIGREQELAEIRRLLADPTCRLLTLVGPGGVGKSRLALEAASLMGGGFLNGVWYVRLADLNPDAPDAIPQALADALQLPLSGTATPQQQIAEFLRHKELLLVLDNLDHLLGQCAWLGQLLESAPDIKILATSRARLNLRAEWLIDLHGLPYPRGKEQATEDLAAMQLFAQRARRLQNSFALNTENRPLVARICRLVHGVPLALEMAATWMRTLSPAQIAAEIEKSLDFLTDPHSDAVDRHRSQRAVFDASWHLLTPAERDAFARLAVFRGGFDSAAAGWVTGCTAQILAGLVDKSLIGKSPIEKSSGEKSPADDESHYSVHPLLQQYALEKLAAQPPVQEAMIDRHIEWFARLLGDLQPDIYGARLPGALQIINRNLDNIRQAWRTAGERGHFAFFAQAVDSLLIIFDINGLSQEAQQMMQEARLRLETWTTGLPEQSIVLAQLLAHEGVFSFRLGQFERAHDYPRQAIGELLRHNAPPFTLGHVYVFLAAAHFGLGEYDAALAAFAAAKDAYGRAGSHWGISTGLGNSAEVHIALRQMEKAREFAAQSYTIGELSQNAYLQSHNAYRMATISAHFEEYDAAQRYHRESLDLAKALNYRGGMANAYSALGDISRSMGKYSEAEQQFDEARAINEEFGNWLDSADCQIQAGNAALACQAYDRASAHLRQALGRAAEIGAGGVLLEGLLEWARLLIAQEKSEKAVPILHFVAADEESSPVVRDQARLLLRQQTGNPKMQPQACAQRDELLADILGYVPRRT
ncbi:MAG: BTAD domain-containing putative transcriptional regulator [Caldilineaceae bacterium]